MGVLALAADERVRSVRCTDDSLAVDLMDGRTIIVPLAWFPRLLAAAPERRNRWQPAGEATASTGPKSTRTSVRKDCFAGLQLRMRVRRADSAPAGA